MQKTFSELEYTGKKKQTRRDCFLADIERLVFGFYDEDTEDAIYDSQAIRGFMGIDLGRESAPDATYLAAFSPLAGNPSADADAV